MKANFTNWKASTIRNLLFRLCLIITLILPSDVLKAQGPLSVATDPICTTQCCSSQQPCSCSAGVIATGGIPPYSYLVFSGTSVIGTTACVTGLCPGTYTFEVRDFANNQVVHTVTLSGTCCKLNCRDTVICYNVSDTAVHLVNPTFTSLNGGGGAGTGGGQGNACTFDSIWKVGPNVYPVGTTVVKWYVSKNGVLDSCTQNVIRNPPSVYNISFTTSPAIVGGVINICNGQTITFNDNSTGTTGRLWNFGNGYYSSNATHTEPAWHYPPGTYYDTLTVFDACGSPHDTAFMVVVDSASGPDIFCISVVCPGDTVTYHTSANCSVYTWSVSGGVFFPPPTATSDSATVIWGAGPSGTITLNVSGCVPALTCAVGTTKTISIVPATLPIAGDTIVCAGGYSCYAVECIPGNNHSWEVLPASAGTVTGQGTCEICIQWNPTFFGLVTIQLNYQNVLTGAGCNLPPVCTDMHGCGGTGTLTVDVRPIFGIDGPAKVCPNTTSSPFNGMNLTNNTIAPGVSWKLVTPVPTTLTFANSALLNAYNWSAGPGDYQLTAYAPPNIYCNDSATVTVTVVNMLVPNNITGPDTVCANVPTAYSTAPNMPGVTYIWTVVGGSIVGPSTGSSVNINWSPGGGTVSVVQVLAATPFCVSAPSAVYTVNTWPNFPLPVISTSNPLVCMNSTITYSIPLPLLSNATYTWSIVPATAGNILSANGTNTITIKWISAAITPIFVKLKISRCYNDSVMLPINLLPLPTVPNIVYSPANPCVNTPVLFSTTNPGPSWNWDFGDLGTSTNQIQSHTYTNAGTYNVQLYVTNASGCSDTATTNITVDGVPVVPVIVGNANVCVNTIQTYSFAEPLFMGANYTWSLTSPALGIISGSGNNFMTLQWTTPGVDSVQVHVQSTCLDTIIKFKVTINALPTAGMTFVTPACANTSVSFTGTGGVGYGWSFPGGVPNAINISNPVVTYPTAGTYPVNLTVVDVNGCGASASSSITINPAPIAIINGPSLVCAFPATVTYTAVSAPGYTFAWTPAAITPSITVTVNALTTFSCIVTNSFGCTAQSNFITVDSLSCTPIQDTCIYNDSIDFTYTPPICLTQTYTKIYTATHTGWSFGGYGSAGPTSPVSNTYPFPGIFPVTVSGTAVGVYPHGAPCLVNIYKTRNVTIPFDARFDFKFQCNGGGVLQTIFTNNSLFLGVSSLYTWQWYDVTTASVLSTLAFPGPITMSPGTHVVNLNIFDPVTGATCTITKTLVVPTPIVAAFTVSSPICAGAPNTFTNTSTNLFNLASQSFNNGNGGFATTSPVSIPYAIAGSFTASLSVTDIYGCNSSITKPVTVIGPGAGTLTVGPLGCDSVQLTASGPGPFTWNVITPPPFPNNPAYVKTSGYYSVSGIGVNGCPYTAGPVNVTVKKSPVVTITGKTNYCQGEALDLKTSAAGITYAWVRMPSTPVGGNFPNLNIIATTPGTFTYKVTVTAANGCSSFAFYTITVDPVPTSAVIVASGPLTFCQGDSVKLSVNPQGTTYLWSKSPGPAIASPFDTDTILWVKQSGTYSVIVQTSLGCSYPAIAPVTVVVNPVPPANITGDTTICEGETLQLTTTSVGGATYSWTGPGATGVTNPFVKPLMLLSNAGVYSVIVTNTFGCTAVDSINVIVNPAPLPPVIISNPGGVLCEGSLFNISVSGPTLPPFSYSWSTGQLGYSINTALTGDYSVTATNIFGCSATSNIITIHPNPDLSCVPTGCYEFCNECDSVIIPGPFGLAYYNWEKLVGGIFVPYSSNQNLAALPPGGKFRLIASTIWGCSDSTDTLNIDFMDCCPAPPPPVCLDTCVNFDNNTLQGWMPDPIAPNVGVSVTNVGSQSGALDYFVFASDLVGPSQLLAGDQFDGKWCCGELCFDYKIFDDGLATSLNYNPSFTIRNGTLGFRFTSSVLVNENSPWTRICAPITDCGLPPVTTSGTWVPLAGTAVVDWTTVLGNVTDLNFRVDYSTAIGETSGFDNVCVNSNVPNINAGNDTTICEGQVITLQVAGCTGIPQWNILVGDSLIFYANGPIIDAMPLVNTCYVVICCGAAACCCDTDTVCVTVNPHPILQWNWTPPSLCANGSPITLDSANIQQYIGGVWVPLTPGTGVFSGVGVTGNVFTPAGPGVYTVTYTFTDIYGCSASISAFINVITCCDTTFQISAGPDQSICQGGAAILSVTGCTGTPQWYGIGVEGLYPVGQGVEIDVLPQQSTCYIVICCITPTCCDTDTVCVTVNPHPILQWNWTPPSLCANGSPITLDSANIQQYIGGVWVPLTPGTGVFSGVGVTGNVFTPAGPGVYTVTYTFTDICGCSASISAFINVITCCDTTFQVNAGPDQDICAGGIAILQASGCGNNSIPQWYAIGVEGNVLVHEGPVFDAQPQQTTCYMVICCPTPLCCDTDTVCVTVHQPPIIQWMISFVDMCQNGPAITLDAINIFQVPYINGPPTPLVGGSGVFSGPGVVGNTFVPGAPGVYTITYTYTDPYGCVTTCTNTINVIVCCDPNFNVNAGPDQDICAGGIAILQASGCGNNSIPQWYAIGVEGNVLVHTGAVFDAQPQQTTCYMVICCPTPLCCDTDTVCVTVHQPPVIQWMISFVDVCLNGTPVFLDPINIFQVPYIGGPPTPLVGGSGVFSGPGVVGNTFVPSTLGPNVITYTYTDPYGCVTTCTNTINVIVCCDPNFNVNAGPDQNICAGGIAILQASGCGNNSIPQWYAIGVEGNVLVHTGAVFDAQPQQTTCYMVICCPTPLCCDTDTVCVTVHPNIVIQWMVSFVPMCLNATPLSLSAANIFLVPYIGGPPSPLVGGSGFFAGPGVVGNTFVPSTLGPHTIYYYYTDANGCQAVATNIVNVIPCGCGPCYHPGVNVVANGGFEIGNTGFTSQLLFNCGCISGTYCISDNANTKCSNYASTTSPVQQSPNFMIVDGTAPGASEIWQQNIAISDTASYEFSFWLNPELTPIVDSLRPDLEVRVGTTVILTLEGTALADGWIKYEALVSGVSGTSLSIHQINAGSPAGGFAIDAISLIPCIPNVVISLTNIHHVNCVGVNNGSVTATGSGGTSPYSYQWSNGATTAGITGLAPGVYTVTVTDANGCTNKATITILLLPTVTPGPISGGIFTACLPAVAGSTTYTIPAIAGATYSWAVPNGMYITSGQGTNSLVVNWPGTSLNAGIIGQICIEISSPCGNQIICRAIDINAVKPVTPPSISGPAKVCPGDIVVYSIAPVARASYYTWTLPTGMSFVSGAGTNVITVSVGPAFVGGNISVVAGNACGVSPVRTKAVALNTALTPLAITGPVNGLCGVVGATYSIASVSNAVSYLWTVTNGTIIGSNTGTSITVNWSNSFINGVVSVAAVNGCGIGAVRSLNVKGAPATPGPITGNTLVCFGSTYPYQIATVMGTTNYQWTAPGTITNGQGTKTISVQFNSVSGGNQIVSVRAQNNCGSSAYSALTGITVNFCTRISGSDYDEFTVYPNPADNEIELTYLSKEDDHFRIEILDPQGKVLYQVLETGNGELLKRKIDVSLFATGLYLINITDRTGVHQQKVIIH